uniref:Ig-like domain-containing protein n=1 Tax=Terrapene triunguis TaxID=2587831 RepID=A0A674IUU9_9SAUR
TLICSARTLGVLHRQLILFASLLYIKLTGLVALLCRADGECSHLSGFIKSPLSQKKLTEDSVELHCEAIGNPIPEIQWWFEGDESNETYAQLWDGARQDRVKINATYNLHSTSTIYIANLMINDSGTYECRASNDPDRNHLRADVLSVLPELKDSYPPVIPFTIRDLIHSGPAQKGL